MPGVVKLNPDAVLYDQNGNPIGVELDGSIYRLQTETTLKPGHGLATEAKQDTLLTELQLKADLTEKQPVNLHDKDGTGITSEADGSKRRLHVDAKFPAGQSVIIGNSVDPDLSKVVRSYVLSGGSSDMKVNGSVTPVNFDFNADPTDDLLIYEVRFVLGTQDITFDGASFGSLAALTNGVTVNMTYNNGQTATLATIRINEDLLFFPTPSNYLLNNTGPKDILVMGLSLGGAPILVAGTSDKVRITISDNLTGGGANELSTFKAQVFAVKA